MELYETMIPMIDEVEKLYVHYRRKGLNRENAVEQVKVECRNELQDDQDRIAVWLGLAAALSRKRELYIAFAHDLENECLSSKNNSTADSTELMISKLWRLLENPALFGPQAVYKKRTTYIPKWEVGDVFYHILSCPTAACLGIEGWYVVFYKVGEYIDAYDICHQAMHLSFCPASEFSADIPALIRKGFFQTIYLQESGPYLADLEIKSKKQETAYDLHKIGHTDDLPISSAMDITEGHAIVGITRKGECWPAYEEQICFLWKQSKKGKL